MGFDIKVLKSEEEHKVYTVFEQCFEGYSKSILFHQETHLKAWQDQGLLWELSYGIYQGPELVGFLLHGIKEKQFKNIVTGVLPNYRGQGLLKEAYTQIIPELRLKGIEKIILHVLIDNESALRAYTKVGFRITRRSPDEFEMMKFV